MKNSCAQNIDQKKCKKIYFITKSDQEELRMSSDFTTINIIFPCYKSSKCSRVSEIFLFFYCAIFSKDCL